MVARLEKASKRYKSGDSIITALEPTDFQINAGEMTLIIGPSGSGKTTLLSLLGCVIYPTEGSVWINGENVTNKSESELAAVRLKNIGFVFQSFNLIAPLTVQQNVMLPMTLLGKSEKEAKAAANESLAQLGLAHRLQSLPKMLSGGEQQRVAIARALSTNPPMLLCDEPTASLDVKSFAVVMGQLQEQAKLGKAVAVVTHDMRLVPYATRIVEVINGAAIEADVQEFIKRNVH